MAIEESREQDSVSDDSPKGGTEPGHAQQDAREAGSAAAHAPDLSADTDPIAVEADQSAPGLMSRLNPLNIFRRNSPEALVSEGKELLDNKSYAQATVAFQKALQLDPNHVGAYRGLGKVFFKKGGRSNMENALKHYLEAIKRHPMDHDLYAISAKIYDALGKRKEATLERKKFVIVRALDADPKNPIANNNMGILFLQQGRTDSALSYFNKAIDSDKNYDVAHRNLAAAYFQMAKKEQDQDKKSSLNGRAKAEILKAVKITPSVPSLLAHARILLAEGNLEEVITISDRIDEMDPANKDVYHLKKLAYEGLGKFEEARNAQESYVLFAKEAEEPSEE